MRKRVFRPTVREGYDRWSETYDSTSNPLVALDRRHTLRHLAPKESETVLDAGCGTGAHLRTLERFGCRPAGVDLSYGMLRVAQRAVPNVPLAQADLNRDLPVKRNSFDAFLCSLVSEHLKNIRSLFSEAFAVLRPGGRFIFSAFHPEMAAAGVEANFSEGGREYRLGAEPHTTSDYLNKIFDAGFRGLHVAEYEGDSKLVDEVPGSERYVGRPLLLVVYATRPTSKTS